VTAGTIHIAAAARLGAGAFDAEALAGAECEGIGVTVTIVVETITDLVCRSPRAHAFDHSVDAMIDARLALSLVRTASVATTRVAFIDKTVAVVVEVVAFLGHGFRTALTLELSSDALDNTGRTNANVRATGAASVDRVLVGGAVTIVVFGVANLELRSHSAYANGNTADALGRARFAFAFVFAAREPHVAWVFIH